MSAALKDTRDKVVELCDDLKRQVYGNYLNRIDEIERLLCDLKLELLEDETERLLCDLKLELLEIDCKDKLSEYREELYQEQHPVIIRDENDL